MRVLFYLGHPAHFHTTRPVADALAERGHAVLLAARKKDVLLSLLAGSPHETVVVSTDEDYGSTLGMVWAILLREWRMLRAALRFKPDLLVGTDIVITHVGRLLGVPAVILNEDDAREVPLLAQFGFRFARHVLSPRVCDISPHEGKKIAYESYHELAYLHPNRFTPDPDRVCALLDGDGDYFILRFSSLAAHHDDGRTGITDAIAQRLIRQLERRGRVFVTSERPLDAALEPYRIRIAPADMHHALAHATLYIGDSQTMAAEAAVLGTPAVRFNDFVGKLGYLEELEHRYGLTFGIRTEEPERLYATVDALLRRPDLKREWQERRQRMLAEKVDFCAFLTWFIEGYPASARAMAAGVRSRGGSMGDGSAHEHAGVPAVRR